MSALAPGAQIGSYRIVRQLGAGGMGAVYEAVHEGIERRAAIKVLHASYAQDKDLVARFFNEAKAANRIEHPGLVQIYDFGQLAEGGAYLVMELLRGETLGTRLRRQGRLAETELIRLGLQAADTLAAAHAKDIVHRDLKPDNLMVVPDPVAPGGERVKILDFGIAKLSSGSSTSATLSQVVMGTPRYMAPEQCRSASAAFAPADVYALGIIFYEALTGRTPFDASEPGELLAMQLRDVPPPISTMTPELPADLAALVMRMLAKAPEARPVMAAVAAALRDLDSASESALYAATVPPFTPGPASSRSTLGRASGESLHAKSRTAMRSWPLVGIGGVGLAAVLGLVMHHRSAQRPAPAASSPYKGQEPAVRVQAASSAQQPAPPSQAPARTPTIPSPLRDVEWIIESEPQGAEVYDAAGARLGKTPWQTRRPAAPGEVTVRVQRRGYREEKVQLGTDSDQHRRITLQRRPEPTQPAESSDDIPLPRFPPKKPAPRKESAGSPDEIPLPRNLNPKK